MLPCSEQSNVASVFGGLVGHGRAAICQQAVSLAATAIFNTALWFMLALCHLNSVGAAGSHDPESPVRPRGLPLGGPSGVG
jgi:hypothetical protein